MGGDIAAWCAGQDLRVTLADMKPEPIAGTIKRAADLYGKILRKRTAVRDALDRLMPDMQARASATPISSSRRCRKSWS
jgi:3-hydroxyacyl-CoA dehydrogenase/enoyl-CoA hydratase/3-hydroxybutyryl-CoA epimerase